MNNKHLRENTIAVVPAYNEELSIGSVVLKARKRVDRVVVVDDGSSDRTGEVASFAGAEVLQLEENSGKAYALVKGLEWVKRLDYQVVVLLDGDGQHETDEIFSVVEPVLKGEADMVIGSRFLRGNDIPRYRTVGQKVLNLATNFGSNSHITDSQSGFRALSRLALDFLEGFESEDYNVESDMISHLSSKGLEIKEVPISARYEVPNKHKKNPISHGMGVLSSIIGLIGYRRPLLSFGLVGGVFTVIGLGFGFWAFSDYARYGSLHYGPSMGSAVFLILGLLCIMSGLILNSLVQIMKVRNTAEVKVIEGNGRDGYGSIPVRSDRVDEVRVKSKG